MSDVVDFDVETTGLQAYADGNEAFLWIFSDGEEAEAIPFSPSKQPIPSWGITEWTDDAWAAARNRVQKWFDRASKLGGIRAHNAKFDRAFAEQAGCFTPPPDGMWHDSMVVAHAIDERRSVALKAIAAQLFGDEAADPQKKLKEWLNAENKRRSKLIKDAEKAAAGRLKIAFADEEGKSRRRDATQDEIDAIIAESKLYLHEDGTWERANYSHVPQEIMEPYALEDVILTRRVCDVYQPRLEQAEDLKGLVEFERKAMDALFAIEARGLPAREEEYRKLEQEVIKNIERLGDRVQQLANEADPVIYARELAGKAWGPEGQFVERSEDSSTVTYSGGAASLEDFNPNSTAQILACLKARKADMSYMSEKDGKISADKDNLQAVDDALAAAILEFRAEFKVLSTYVRPMIGRSYVSMLNTYKEPFIAPDSRIHANYRQVGARTGRMSCIAAGSYVDAPRDLLKYPKGIKIEDVKVGDYVYSFDDQSVPRPKKVLNVLEQGRKRVLKLVWRAAGNKSYLGTLRATPDHRVRLRDGSYKRMDALVPGDQLAFLSRQVTGDGYARICWKHGSGDGVASAIDEHRHLVTGGEVVHHVDEQKLNNELTNLAPMTMSEHSILHNPPGPRPERNKPCPYSTDLLAQMVSKGIRNAIQEYGHDYRTYKRWCAEAEVSIPDRRTRDEVPTNHVVVAVIDEGEEVETYDLTIEDTPNFVVNEIGVHNCSDPNMQNQPRDDLRLRYNIVADPGHVLVTCDLTNIEMYLFAAYCGEGRLLNAVQKGEDLHTLTARMLGLRDRKRPGGGIETARQLGKTYNFSRVYGGGLRTIRRQFRCSLDEARLLKRRFDEAYPEVQRLQNRIEYKLYDDGYIQDKLISGRRFRVDPREAYKATNYLVQGTAASLLKYAVVKLHEDGVPMVALVHDEIVAHVPASEAQEAAKLIEARMTEFEGLKGVVPLKAEADIVKRWSDAKPLKGEGGAPYLFTPQWAGGKKRPVPDVDDVLRSA